MIKATILVLAGAGIVGTGGQVVSPKALELSAGAVAYQITTEGVETSQNQSPEFGITLITKGDRQVTIRF